MPARKSPWCHVNINILYIYIYIYIYYFHLLTNKFVSFLFIFSGITFLCPIIIHCVVHFSKNRKIGYEVYLLMLKALIE